MYLQLLVDLQLCRFGIPASSMFSREMIRIFADFGCTLEDCRAYLILNMSSAIGFLTFVAAIDLDTMWKDLIEVACLREQMNVKRNS